MRNDGEENISGKTVTNEIIVVSKKEMDEKDELIASLKIKAEKMKSDFARYKERTQNEEEAIRRKTSGELARQLLIVADTLERAVYNYEGDAGGVGGCEVVDRMVEGSRSSMEMTYNQLLDASGIAPIAPSAGERFNDELHTAIEITQDPLLPDKTIMSLIRKGYMLNNELIRPAEVIISRGGGEPVEVGRDRENDETERTRESKPGTVISRFMRRFVKKSLEAELKEIGDKEQKLEVRARELVRNEEILRNSVKELDLRENEFKKREEEWTKREEEAESGVLELEQRNEVLKAEIKESKKQLSAITNTLNEQMVNKDKIVVESIALGRYNEELSEEREKLLNEINEMEGKREALNYELADMGERRAWNIEEESKMGQKIAEIDEKLSMSERELQKSKELVNVESEEVRGLVQRKESLAAEIEETERVLEIAHENLNELDGRKDKLVIESIALRRYNEALLEEQGKLLNEIEIGEDTSEVGEDMDEEKKKKSPFTVSTPFWC
ncbi:MAG: nucleotide exchange factor GrpE [Candidatus Methanogaster sp.]|uniref:Nucleotide exchange factor GrpE n=1 Tax=Candidatus Methanogaster sp. TaxID=3386292 RepID=A0AC61L6W8_9EURY|nr:MAG: nucleotide exchange factor GrpE [ANME-2 cluster archaeon]